MDLGLTQMYDDFGLGEIDPYGGRTAINLYGPPGTGKSFAADAIANELGMGIIRVSYAEIESKYVGETPKNIKAAFQKARETNALLFFDEADSVLGRRLTSVTQSTDHAVNVSRSVMLLELDRFSGVTVFATNLAVNYDPAFVRRILGHIEWRQCRGASRSPSWHRHLFRMACMCFSGLWHPRYTRPPSRIAGALPRGRLVSKSPNLFHSLYRLHKTWHGSFIQSDRGTQANKHISSEQSKVKKL
jgi:hypothetical protein